MKHTSIAIQTRTVSFALFTVLFCTSAAIAQDFDIVIRGGRIVDGSGNPWYEADVGIHGDRIAEIGDLSEAKAQHTIDARGLVVAPGFIDPHTHKRLLQQATRQRQARRAKHMWRLLQSCNAKHVP